MTRIRRRARTLATALLVGALAAPLPALSGEKDKQDVEKRAAPAALKEVGLAFESARLLPGADRVPALEEVDRNLATALRGDLKQEEAAAAMALSAQIRYELQDYRGAADGYRRAAGRMEKSPFVDDAEFVSIRAMEGAGQDRDADGAWMEWEKRHPLSPLRGEARLAQAWNALRRGETAIAAAGAFEQAAILSLSKSRKASTRMHFMASLYCRFPFAG